MKSTRACIELKGKTETILGMVLVGLLLLMGLVACGDANAPANPTPAVEPTTEAREAPTALPGEPTSEPTQAASDGWITFTSEADGFSVDMPGEPQASTQSMESALGELTFHFFQLTDGGSGTQYVVSYNDYPAEMTAEDLDPDSVLNDAIEATAQGSQVEKVQRIEVQGNPGIEGEMNLQGATHIWYRGILSNNRLYQLFMGAPETDKAEFADEARRFIESFTLLNQ